MQMVISSWIADIAVNKAVRDLRAAFRDGARF